MATLLRTLLLALGFLSLWILCPALMQAASDSVVLVFADGTQAKVTDWTFFYEFVESDTPPPDRTIIIKPSEFTEFKSKDLLLSLRYATQRRDVRETARRILRDDLRLIKFEKQEEGSIGVTVSLVTGESIRIRHSSGFEPAKELLRVCPETLSTSRGNDAPDNQH